MDQPNYQVPQNQPMPPEPMQPTSYQDSGKSSKMVWIIIVVILLLALIGAAIFYVIQFQENQASQSKIVDLQKQLSVKNATIETLNQNLASVKYKADLVSFIFTEVSKPSIPHSEEVTFFLELQKRVQTLNDPMATEKLNAVIMSPTNPHTQDLLLYLIQSVSK